MVICAGCGAVNRDAVFWASSLSIGAILISSFVLISPNRQNTDAGIRAELAYAVTIQTYRHIEATEKRLDALVAALESGTEVRKTA